jgi:4-hydroxy-tetrahydrodipicolinate synthase
MTEKKFSGVYAAVLTPRRSDDSVDTAGLTRLTRFLISRGVRSFALNGATGEFCLTKTKHLQSMLRTVRDACDGSIQILCGVGAPSLSLVTDLAAIAEEEGANGLLLPMPYFFRYEQEDLDAFCCMAAKSTGLPVLLYNLPQFSTGIDKATVRKLIAEVPNIVGIKDSGGSLDILRDLTEHKVDACRIVGNDPVLRPALAEGVCDGVVSGIACVLPELVTELYSQGHHAANGDFDDSWRLLREVAKELDAMPTPWALKWIAEARGIFHPTFSQSLSESRQRCGAALKTWFREWFREAIPGGTLSM